MSPIVEISLALGNHDAVNTGPDPELAGLIAGCKAGERTAQEAMYKRYYGKMMAMCQRYIGNRDDAMEVLNMGFLKVFRSLEGYEASGSFDGWVYRIIYNSVIDYLRSKVKAVKTVEIDDAELHLVDASAIQQLYVDDLLKLLDCLPESTRIVFNMFALEGYRHEEIADMLGISTGTSKWHVNQAREILKQQITQKHLRS